MKWTLLFLTFFLIHCVTENKPELNSSIDLSVSIVEEKSYAELTTEVANKKEELLRTYTSTNNKDSLLSVAGAYMDSAISEILFPKWLGTKWDFNGHTNIPKEGEIACGYLVSTLLKHSGLNINRYRLAQQSSLSEIKTLSTPEAPLFLGRDHEKALAKIEEMPDGLYILGLSFHVGYIKIKNNKVHFLHSTYLEPTAVIDELAHESAAFISSSVYYLGKISGNPSLVKKWLKSEEIAVVMD